MNHVQAKVPAVSWEEFIAYWFAHHMPATIDAMGDRGWGYIGTIFDSAEDDQQWDGMAQMFLNEPLPNPRSDLLSVFLLARSLWLYLCD